MDDWMIIKMDGLFISLEDLFYRIACDIYTFPIFLA